MKKTVLALAFVLFGSFMLSGCSKDEILDHYNNIVQSAGTIELTGKLSLEGTKEKGIDDYTGTYTADYEDFSDTEYLFGGTSIKREAGMQGFPEMLLITLNFISWFWRFCVLPLQLLLFLVSIRAGPIASCAVQSMVG